MDSVRVEGVRNWPRPKSVKDVRSFLGFINFYRRFITKFSDIARPLNDKTKKDRKWEWTDADEEAFEELKRQVTSAPILTLPDVHKPFIIETDASGYAYGAVLSQNDEECRTRPIAFLSR